MANEDLKRLRERVRSLEGEMAQASSDIRELNARVEALEEGSGPGPLPEIIGSEAELKVYAAQTFPPCGRWQDGPTNKSLCKQIRDAICKADSANSTPWPDSADRHFDAVVRGGRVIDFARDSDGEGVLYDRLQWADGGPYVP